MRAKANTHTNPRQPNELTEENAMAQTRAATERLDR